MNQFHKPFRWAWSILVVCTLAFAMGGCEGDDGDTGPAGQEARIELAQGIVELWILDSGSTAHYCPE